MNLKLNRLKSSIKKYLPIQSRSFGLLSSFDQNTTAFRMTKYDPKKELEGHNPTVLRGDEVKNYKIKKLNNGITVITETTNHPTSVHMGVLLNVGVRDETQETSGSCHALKSTYLKTVKHTNETINYGMIQMSGGETEMTYDEETMYYRTNCFEYDVIDMFRMLADISFEPRSMLSANVAKDKLRQAYKLNKHLAGYHPFQDNPQRLLTTAYGYNSLGMPLLGFESNISNIDSEVLKSFQMKNITPEKTTIVASGLKCHDEFFDLVNETLGVLNPVREQDYKRTPSVYIGGEFRTFTETPDTNIILAYESVNWTHEDMPVFAVLQTLFGNGTGFSVGGPGKGMHSWASTNILQVHHFISECQAINSHFTDSGLFGLNFTGNSHNSKDILLEMLNTFNKFKSVNEVDLQRAKNILKRQVLLGTVNQVDRLEEVARTFNIHKDISIIDNYVSLIDQVNADRVNKAVTRLLKGKPTLVVTGNAVNLVPSIADIQGMIR